MASLFKKAKDTAPEKKVSAKEQKVRVMVDKPGFYDMVKRQSIVLEQIKTLQAEADLNADEIKETGKEEWAKLFDKTGVNPESIMIVAKDGEDTAQFMHLMSDKYIIIDQQRADWLKEQFGNEIVTESETYQFDKDMVEKYGEVISDLIMNCDQIAELDKERIIKAVVKNEVAKGTIDKLSIYAKAKEMSVLEMVDVVKPVCSTKNVSYIPATTIY